VIWTIAPMWPVSAPRRAMVALYPTWEIRYNTTNTLVERNNRVASVADTLFKDRTWVSSGATVVVELV
jgi:hypothetical protein